MNLKEIVGKTRSYRRFQQDVSVSREILLELIDLARLAGSARNLQPLKYMISNDPKKNAEIFPHLSWAGYLAEWDGPAEGEQPSAYIICLLDTEIAANGDCDLGIASQNILIGAANSGLGGCRIASVSSKLKANLNFPPHLNILMVIALGVPVETVQIDPVDQGGSIKYWRDSNQVHHVPKRSLDEIIINTDK